MKIRTVDQLELTGKRTLIRVDFNVPMDKAGNVTDDTRLQAARAETLELIIILLIAIEIVMGLLRW